MTEKKNTKVKIETLVELLLSGRELPAEFLESLQAWLIDGTEKNSYKDVILGRGFDRMVHLNESKEFALKSWSKLAKKLGMDPDLARRAVKNAHGYETEKHDTVRHARRKKSGFGYSGRYAVAVISCLISLPLFYLTARLVVESRADQPFVVSPSDTLRLPDGSKVVVGPNSSISYTGDFAQNRKVSINGEAFFSVMHDKKHPFVVEGKDIKVVVAGTEFNMRAFDAENLAEVELIKGSIRITAGELDVMLKPSERAIIDRTSDKMEITGTDDGEMLKRLGMNLQLGGVSLEKALTMIGGYFEMNINIPSDLPAVNGVVLDLDENATLDDALFLLQAANPIFDYNVRGSNIFIVKR